MTVSATEPSAPGASPVTYHVFTDAQFNALLHTITPGPTLVGSIETVAKTGAEDVVANIKALIADAEGTVSHVHGAAKQLQADVKANRVQIMIGVVAVAALILNLWPMIHGLL